MCNVYHHALHSTFHNKSPTRIQNAASGKLKLLATRGKNLQTSIASEEVVVNDVEDYGRGPSVP